MIAGGAVLLAGSAYLVFSALAQNVAYFYEPTEALTAGLTPETRIRLGGLVEAGSVNTADGVETVFRITDGATSIPVSYTGILPDLFREGQGVVTQGRMNAEGVFVAETILAKHDENYVPRELKDLMEEHGGAGV